MQNSNYVILIDENGQPYLSHSIWDRAKSAYSSARSAAGNAYGSARSAGNRAVKYIEKIGDGAKARYFYTQDELKAYYDNARSKANNAAQQAKQKAQSAVSNGKARAERMHDDIRSGLNKAADTIKDRAGVDERERAEAAWNKVGPNSSKKDWEAAEKAQAEYRKTPLGRLDYAKERAWEIATGQDGTAKEIAQDLGRKAVDKAKDIAGVDERERLDEARKARDEMYDRGLELAAEREPLRQAYIDFDNEMFEKYGANYDQKMTNSEKSKYEKLESDLTEISEQWWDATIRQMYPAAYGSDPTLTDKLKEAEAEFRATPLGKLEEFRKRRK